MIGALAAIAMVAAWMALVEWSSRPARAYSLAVLAVVAVTSAFWVWLLKPGSTGKGLLDPSLLTRFTRWNRSVWLRAASSIAGWPHYVLRLLGLERAAFEGTPGRQVWSQGGATLTRYGEGRGEAVLLVHALVTRPWILDLSPGASLVQALRDAGHDVYLLDWGDPVRATRHDGLDAYAAVLTAAEQEVLRISGRPRLHLIGYCLGGTLSLARLAAIEHEHVASFAAIASPVDLAVPGGMQRFVTHRMLKPAMLLDGSGCVPSAVIRGSFHLLRPQALKSFGKARRTKRDPDALRWFASLSRWVWYQRALPGALFFDLVDMYRTNALFRGELSIGGRPCRLRAIKTPVLMAVAERDHIVPGSASHALATAIEIEVLPCPSGHVSLLVGRGAGTVLFPGLVTWLAKNKAPSPPTRRTRKKADTSVTSKNARSAKKAPGPKRRTPRSPAVSAGSAAV